MDWLKELQGIYQCPVLQPGDLFHHWKPSPELLVQAMDHMPHTWAVLGNHDLPGHRSDQYDRTGFAVLARADKVRRMNAKQTFLLSPDHPAGIWIRGFAWDEEPEPPQRSVGSEYPTGLQVAIIHTMIWDSKENRPHRDIEGGTARALMRKLKGYDLIVTGDNHKQFVCENDGQILVNAGSVMRMTADQDDHNPRAYLWFVGDAGNGKQKHWIEPHEFPISKGVVSREHLDQADEKDARIDAFVSRLREDVEIGLSFEDNLKAFFEKNKTSKKVQEIVWESLEE
jgi:DNA repair exonuclease SbcCD nuclease subunit